LRHEGRAFGSGGLAGMRPHLVLATLWVSGTGSAAPAFCPKPPPKVCGEFFKSDAVFIGTAVSEQDLRSDNNDDGWLYRLRVHRAFRGEQQGEVEVFTENTSVRFPLEMDRDYLLFATRLNNRLEITSCGNSGLVAERQDQIVAIQDLPRAPTLIEGHVAARPDWNGVPGVRFEIKGNWGGYSAVSDETGSFTIAVRPGSYSVAPKSTDVVPFDLSYDDPKHVSLKSGQCAQLQFVR
jgi:hypothetical protein